MKKIILFCLPVCIASCHFKNGEDIPNEKNFGYDVEFLRNHKDIIVLKNNNELSQVVIVRDYQGRVMSSTANGINGTSYGWINYDLISSGKIQKQINVFGGEDRFWIGPEGGQYGFFFEKGDSFTMDNWKTPACIDTEPFELITINDTSAMFRKNMTMKNYSGTEFTFDLTRIISVFSNKGVRNALGIPKINNKIKCVGYQSLNTIKNSSDFNWTKDKGLLSIWILGMYKPSDKTTIVIPVKKSSEGEIKINSSYFGTIPNDRLKTIDTIVYFKGDGKYRGKIGVSPKNVKTVLGSYDSEKNILTIIKFDFENAKEYVNSTWKLQDEPYKGDVANSYNDGPIEKDGKQLGPFYELETSSAAKELKKNEEFTHIHKTFHFEGDKEELEKISKEVLGVGLNQISNVFSQ